MVGGHNMFYLWEFPGFLQAVNDGVDYTEGVQIYPWVDKCCIETLLSIQELVCERNIFQNVYLVVHFWEEKLISSRQQLQVCFFKE